MTEELNEDNDQIIQNTLAGTREHTEDMQAIKRRKQKL